MCVLFPVYRSFTICSFELPEFVQGNVPVNFVLHTRETEEASKLFWRSSRRVQSVILDEQSYCSPEPPRRNTSQNSGIQKAFWKELKNNFYSCNLLVFFGFLCNFTPFVHLWRISNPLASLSFFFLSLSLYRNYKKLHNNLCKYTYSNFTREETRSGKTFPNYRTIAKAYERSNALRAHFTPISLRLFYLL